MLDVTSTAEKFAAAGLLPDSVDVVLMNPPFNDASRHRASPDGARAIAHVAAAETLDGWIHAARRILKSGGNLVMIWRADGIADVLAALGRGFGSLMILPIHADAASPAIRVLIRATKGGRAPTCLLAGLVLNDEAGRPSLEARTILAGEGHCRWQCLDAVETSAGRLLRNWLRALFRRRGEMNRREKDTEQRHQQIDFHGVLRCIVTA